jgi:ankyrin repeat protein
VAVNGKDVDGATCLMFAAMRGHASVVELLMQVKMLYSIAYAMPLFFY